LLCGISYMLGGNNITQKDIIDEMNLDEFNLVMTNIDNLISKLGRLILKNIDSNDSREYKDN
jgi:hypothetical protein